MRRLPVLTSLLLLAAACAPAIVHESPSVAPHAQAAETGGAWVTLRGNYVGKYIRIWIDGELADDRRFTFPPPGAEDRLPVAPGPARTVRLRIEIEGCDPVWEQDVAVAPGKSSSLIFEGCAVSPLSPE